jgi:hypothetical protein
MKTETDGIETRVELAPIQIGEDEGFELFRLPCKECNHTNILAFAIEENGNLGIAYVSESDYKLLWENGKPL